MYNSGVNVESSKVKCKDEKLIEELSEKVDKEYLELLANAKEKGISLIWDNLAGHGIGKWLNNYCARIYVRRKIVRASLSAEELIPETLGGVRTKIVQVGELEFLSRSPAVLCGDSIGQRSIGYGTLGCLVKKTQVAIDEETDSAKKTEFKDSVYILSNNHVMGNPSQIGQDVIQPGKTHGGTLKIAELSDSYDVKAGRANDMDAAIARVLDKNDVDPKVIHIMDISSTVKGPMVYHCVQKFGQGTGHTEGVIQAARASRIKFRGLEFQNQIEIGNIGTQSKFCDHGDSGSVVFDILSNPPHPVGLLFGAGSNGLIGFATRMDVVLRQFKVEVKNN